MAARDAGRGTYDRSALRIATVWAVAVKIAALILVMHPGGLNTFAVPKVLVSRAFAWLLVGLLALTILRYGPSVVPRTRLHVAVATYVLVVIASAVFAPDTYTAVYGAWGRGLGLAFVLDMVVLYMAVAVAFRMEADRLILVRAIGAATLVAIAYASAQYAGLDPVAWTPDPRVRPFGTLGHPDPFAHLLAVAGGGALALAVVEVRPGVRWAAGGVAAAAILTATFVATRAVLVGLAASALAVLALWLAAHRRPSRALWRPVVLAGVALSVVVVGAGLTPLGARLAATLQGTGVVDRLLIYESAQRIAADRPALGWGPDSYGVASLRFARPGTEAASGQERQDNAHDWALQSAATTGGFGLAALLTVIVATTIMLWRQRRSAALAAVLVGSIAYWAEGLLSVGSPALDWVPWVAAAAAAAAPTASWPHQRPFARPRTVIAAVGLGVAVGVASAVGAFSANVAAGVSERLLTDRAFPAALSAARSATSLDSGPSAYWIQLGRTHQAVGAHRSAVEAYAEAASRAPWDPLPWQLLAGAHTALALRDGSSDDRVAALGAAAKGIEMDPNRSFAYINYAQVAHALDDPRGALRAAARAIELYSADPQYDVVAARAAEKLGDAEARETLRALLRVKDSGILRTALTRLDQEGR